jgi:hypothetical protein
MSRDEATGPARIGELEAGIERLQLENERQKAVRTGAVKFANKRWREPEDLGATVARLQQELLAQRSLTASKEAELVMERARNKVLATLCEMKNVELEQQGYLVRVYALEVEREHAAQDRLRSLLSFRAGELSEDQWANGTTIRKSQAQLYVQQEQKQPASTSVAFQDPSRFYAELPAQHRKRTRPRDDTMEEAKCFRPCKRSRATQAQWRDTDRRTFLKCWTSYKEHAWLHNKLRTISATHRDGYGDWGRYARRQPRYAVNHGLRG